MEFIDISLLYLINDQDTLKSLVVPDISAYSEQNIPFRDAKLFHITNWSMSKNCGIRNANTGKPAM